MARNHYPRVIRCHICGSEMSTTAARSMCPECRELRHQEALRRRREAYISMPALDAFIVVSDPTPVEEGGFKRGAVINREQLKYMLLETYMAFTPGTLLTNHAGDIFVVVIKKRGGEKLIHT